jgi:hypothetical protein
LTPQHAKDYLKLLAENIHRFAAHGDIKDSEQADAAFSFGPTGQGNLRYLIDQNPQY